MNGDDTSIQRARYKYTAHNKTRARCTTATTEQEKLVYLQEGVPVASPSFCRRSERPEKFGRHVEIAASSFSRELRPDSGFGDHVGSARGCLATRTHLRAIVSAGGTRDQCSRDARPRWPAEATGARRTRGCSTRSFDTTSSTAPVLATIWATGTFWITR